jgi:hypothetical protein
MKRTLITIGICSLLFAIGLSSAAQQKPHARDMYLDFEQSTKKPSTQRRGKPGSKLRMELVRNNQLSFVTTSHLLQDDDRIAFRAAVNYEGYLTVTNIGTSGKVHVLYSGRVSPTSDMRIPDKGWIRVTGKSGNEVVNFIMSSGPIQELQQIGIPTSGGATDPGASTGNPATSSEAQEILALINSRALQNGRDLVVEDEGNETYAVVTSSQEMTAPIGYSITLKHR